MKPKNPVQFFTINHDEKGQRIDNFLLTHLKGVPNSMIYRIIRKGEVRINSGRVTPKYKIQENDVIRIPPLRQEEKKQNIISDKLDKVKELANCIIYEDTHLLVLNKPSGIAVHGGSGISFGVIEALRTLRNQACFLELVHRLDRETSGVLLITKKRSALKALHQQLRLKQMQREYIALVKGKWPANITIIRAPLLKNTLQRDEQIVKVSAKGKYSETHFQIEECFSNATVIKVRPITGRTHQIRVHAQYAKHPIAHDHRYGDRDFDQQLIFTGLKRLFLHARSLMFFHPKHGKKVTFYAPLSQQLSSCLTILRKNSVILITYLTYIEY
ncbi:MAG: 23S rRNA pseudouridine(955/2504/2580) synthase RluC [Candidatus Arsenophonus melophagi]|nr:23S rRNA pseudouridine(955/2504/2580) synthase RluC [Candidatus Arsenophonus melophagi]